MLIELALNFMEIWLCYKFNITYVNAVLLVIIFILIFSTITSGNIKMLQHNIAILLLSEAWFDIQLFVC